MIIVKIYGGLGNQMFQYAAGKAVSMRLGTILKLDIIPFEQYSLREYRLSYFNVYDEIAKSFEVSTLSNKKLNRFERLIFMVTSYPEPKDTHSIEPHYHYWDGIKKITDNCYLDGYWQSEKYFKNIDDIIRKAFTLKEESIHFNRMEKSICGTESVSVHIRRGDYINNAKTKLVHSVCSDNYYDKAINYLQLNKNNLYFYFFSDDPDWINKRYGNKKNNIIVSGNKDLTHADELILMTKCKHNIISNSSFSWWAAWLNNNDSEIIIAPKKWFANSRFDDKDILGEDWILF